MVRWIGADRLRETGDRPSKAAIFTKTGRLVQYHHHPAGTQLAGKARFRARPEGNRPWLELRILAVDAASGWTLRLRAAGSESRRAERAAHPHARARGQPSLWLWTARRLWGTGNIASQPLAGLAESTIIDGIKRPKGGRARVAWMETASLARGRRDIRLRFRSIVSIRRGSAASAEGSCERFRYKSASKPGLCAFSPAIVTHLQNALEAVGRGCRPSSLVAGRVGPAIKKGTSCYEH